MLLHAKLQERYKAILFQIWTTFKAIVRLICNFNLPIRLGHILNVRIEPDFYVLVFFNV